MSISVWARKEARKFQKKKKQQQNIPMKSVFYSGIKFVDHGKIKRFDKSNWSRKQ